MNSEPSSDLSRFNRNATQDPIAMPPALDLSGFRAKKPRRARWPHWTTSVSIILAIASLVITVPTLLTIVERADFREQLRDFESDTAEFRRFFSTVQQEVNESRQKIAIARDEIENVQKRIATVSPNFLQDLTAERSKIGELLSNLDQLQSQVTQIQIFMSDADALKQAVAAAKEEMNRVEARLMPRLIAGARVPIGTVLPFAGIELPPDDASSGVWRWCEGETLDSSEYPALFKVIGFTYGQMGQRFRLPDYRGKFLRGLGGNSNPLGSVQPDQLAKHDHPHTHFIASSEVGSSDATSKAAVAVAGSMGRDSKYSLARGDSVPTLGQTSQSVGSSVVGTRVGDETRPVNLSVRYIIRVR